MNILLAEYAMGTGMEGTYLLEGKAMLNTLVASFIRCDHNVTYLTSKEILPFGKPVFSTSDNFTSILENQSSKHDAGLIIAPDEILSSLTTIIEKNTLNLGSSSEVTQLCADKLKCTEVLLKYNIPVPQIIKKSGIKCVIKPRFGSASENTFIKNYDIVPDGFIATEFIDGISLSVSLIAGKNPLVLCVNKQIIEIKTHNNSSKLDIEYKGNTVCFSPPYKKEIINVAIDTCKVLGCTGYTGIDIIYNGTPYVIDVNSRPTTSLYGICKVMNEEIADLLLKNVFDELPDDVHIQGEYTFDKSEII